MGWRACAGEACPRAYPCPAYQLEQFPCPRADVRAQQLGDCHVRQGWVQTVHAAQGATATTVLAQLESFRRPVDARALYVAVSRARDQARLYTDDRTRLTTAIGLRDSHQPAALDHDMGWVFEDGIG